MLRLFPFVGTSETHKPTRAKRRISWLLSFSSKIQKPKGYASSPKPKHAEILQIVDTTSKQRVLCGPHSHEHCSKLSRAEPSQPKLMKRVSPFLHYVLTKRVSRVLVDVFLGGHARYRRRHGTGYPRLLLAGTRTVCGNIEK